jgi:hypothetical protein
MQKLKEYKKKKFVVFRLFTSFISKTSGRSSITFHTETPFGEFNCESSHKQLIVEKVLV